MSKKKKKKISEAKSAEEKNYDLYIRERESVVENIYKINANSDNYLVYISTAILGLSISILGFMKDQEIVGFVLLLISWVLLVSCLLLVLLSHKSSEASHRKQVDYLYSYYIEDNDAQCPSAYDTITGILNLIAILFFISGIILFLVFSAINVT